MSDSEKPPVYEKCTKDNFSWIPKFSYDSIVIKNKEEEISLVKSRYVAAILNLSTENVKEKNRGKFRKFMRDNSFNSEFFLKSLGLETAPVVDNGIEDKDSIYIKIPYF